MFFNYRSFVKALNLSLIRQPFRLRRWVYVIVFTGLYLLFLGMVLVGRALDNVFASTSRREPLTQPVFIIAPPRSGTSLLQKLLSLDEERFVHQKMYQTIFPAVSIQRVLEALARLDGRLGARSDDWWPGGSGNGSVVGTTCTGCA